MSNKSTDILINSMGGKGYQIIADTSTYTANYCCIMPLTDIVIDTIVGNGSGESGKTIPQGIPLLGEFTSVKLTSGTAALYKR